MNKNFKPFTCYFCNKLIDNETENSHITTCGSVLEPCPNKCGSYVPRSMRGRHMKECINNRNNTIPRLVKQNRVDYSTASTVSDVSNSPTGSIVSGSYNGVPMLLPPQLPVARPMPQMPNTYRDGLNNISAKFSILEQTFLQLQKNMDIVKNRQDQIQARIVSYENTKQQLETILYQSQILFEWKRSVDMQLNNLQEDLSQTITNKVEYERKWSTLLDEKMMYVHDIKSDFKVHKDNFLKEQLYNREAQNELQSQVRNFEIFYKQENAAVAALWNDQEKEINSVKENISNLASSLDEQKVKHSTFTFDLRAISQVSAENSEKLDKQERGLKEINKSIVQLKLDVEMLEEANINADHILPGHIIWKLSDLSVKMETAKSNTFTLKSPIFHSHAYGYKIRLLIYLNGIKKWKGRHMIACLHVLKGEHDLMLPWPCHIEGDVTIRDLQDAITPKHITKFITAKRELANEETEEPQESSSQYIFVPHSQLLKSNYVKEDVMFIEIKIRKSQKYQSETSL